MFASYFDGGVIEKTSKATRQNHAIIRQTFLIGIAGMFYVASQLLTICRN
jgi:hypothetical protein